MNQNNDINTLETEKEDNPEQETIVITLPVNLSENTKSANPNTKLLNNEVDNRFVVSSAKYKERSEVEDSQFVEVLFKSQRRRLYANKNNLKVVEPEYVLVEVENGMDLGTVTAAGKQGMEKFKVNYKSAEPNLSVLRHASKEDIEKYKANRAEEADVIEKTKTLVERFNLDMKITDSEWQFDRQRLTIYFTAPQRIDFRELVKELARLFKTRIELRQISTREEAKRIGGIGPCGRRLCCTCLCDDFCHVTLDHARTQQLSNNVAKLSGYCGRLKCCLLYEFDTYVEAFKKYPPLDYVIELPEGRADIVKVDIFKDLLYLHVKSAGAYKSITYQELEDLTKQNKVMPPDNGHDNDGKENASENQKNHNQENHNDNRPENQKNSRPDSQKNNYQKNKQADNQKKAHSGNQKNNHPGNQKNNRPENQKNNHSENQKNKHTDNKPENNKGRQKDNPNDKYNNMKQEVDAVE